MWSLGIWGPSAGVGFQIREGALVKIRGLGSKWDCGMLSVLIWVLSVDF